MKLFFSVKCSDGFNHQIISDDEELIISDEGYIPDALMPSISTNNDEDYVSMEIDLDTGQIQNWNVNKEKLIAEIQTNLDYDEQNRLAYLARQAAKK